VPSTASADSDSKSGDTKTDDSKKDDAKDTEKKGAKTDLLSFFAFDPSFTGGVFVG